LIEQSSNKLPDYQITRLLDSVCGSLVRTLKEGCSVVHTHIHAVDIAYWHG
jgi:hypothetical protein